MAIKFDEVDDSYILADSAAMDMGSSSPWSIGIWTRVDDNTGSNYQYLVSAGAWGSANGWHLYLNEASEANANQWAVKLEATATMLSSSAPGADGKNRLIVVTSNGSTVSLHFCEAGQASSQQASMSFSSLISPTAFNIGRRAVTPASRWYGGVAGEFFKIDSHLSADEITALGAGATIWDLGYSPKAYLPMISAESTLYDIAGVHNATVASAPTTVEDFPIRRVKDVIYVGTAAAGGTITGTGTLASQASSISGTGEREITGTGTPAAQASAIDGAGIREATGTGALAADDSTIAGTGVREITGAGAPASQDSQIDGTGTAGVVHTGAGALTSQDSAVSGTGIREITGTGDTQAQDSGIAGTGLRTITGTGALSANDSTVEGTGNRITTVTGTGALQAGNSSIYAPAPGRGGYIEIKPFPRAKRIYLYEEPIQEPTQEEIAEGRLTRLVARTEAEPDLIEWKPTELTFNENNDLFMRPDVVSLQARNQYEDFMRRLEEQEAMAEEEALLLLLIA